MTLSSAIKGFNDLTGRLRRAVAEQRQRRGSLAIKALKYLKVRLQRTVAVRRQLRGGPAPRSTPGPDAPAESPGTFCMLAFNHLQLAPNGTAKMCCIASDDISDADGPMTLYRHRYDDIWNSAYMRDARRRMAEGKKVAACGRCYHEEKVLGQSRRTQMNAFWLPQLPLSQDEILKQAAKSDWRVEARPTFLQLNLGNLCNLACRMCGSLYSSKIASDPVHNKWMPPAHIDIGRWVNDKLSIAPRPTFGVTVAGFYPYEPHPDQPLRWTNGRGRISFTLEDGVQLRKLVLRIRAAKAGQGLQLMLNGSELFRSKVDVKGTELEFDMACLGDQREFELDLISGTVSTFGLSRPLGVAVLDATVWRSPPANAEMAGNARAFTRFHHRGGWWSQPEVTFDELLAEPTAVRRLIFQGGEPLIIPEVAHILDHLVAHGAANSVTIELTSNMTMLTDSMVDKLSRFRQVDAGASIDGIRGDFEYIRYPAKWAEVEKNIQRLAKLPNVVPTFNVAVQLYNLLRITDLYRYCDRHNITVMAHFLVGPHYLSVLVMPLSARRLALQRLRAYLGEPCDTPVHPSNRASAEYLVHFLEQHATIHYAEQVRTFMEFTNDMDVSRGQSFAAVHPELVDLLAKASYPWIKDTRHAKREAYV